MSDENELKRKIDELKERNSVLGLSVQRSRNVVRRLKLEYGVLLERLESRVQIDPELNYQNPLPTLETFRAQLLSHPLKKAKSKRQRTKERDPNMPKRPTNAYLLYCETNKDRIRENGSFDVTKDLTEGWKSLTEEERAPYYKLYNEDRKRYQAEMEQYNKNLEKDGTTATVEPTDDDDEEEDEDNLDEDEDEDGEEEDEINEDEDDNEKKDDETPLQQDKDSSTSTVDQSDKPTIAKIVSTDVEPVAKKQRPNILNPMSDDSNPGKDGHSNTTSLI